MRNNRPETRSGKLKKQNASNGRKTHTPAKPDKNETRRQSTGCAHDTELILQALCQIVKGEAERNCTIWHERRTPVLLIDNTPLPWYNKSQRGHGGIGRLGGFRFHCESVQVRVLLPAPNKVDNFDTTGIETINLILFVKMLDLQGFSVSW